LIGSISTQLMRCTSEAFTRATFRNQPSGGARLPLDLIAGYVR
jgi:hypothetical protein